MDPLTWTGPLGQILAPALGVIAALFTLALVAQIVMSVASAGERVVTNPDGTLSSSQGAYGTARMATKYTGLALVIVLLAYIGLGAVGGPGLAGIIGGMSQQLIPVWIALIATYTLSIMYKRKLGLYGKLFDSTVGMVGFGLVMFWVYAGVMAGVLDWITTHDSLSQVSGMKNKSPGTPLFGAEEGEYAWYLLGGDNLARDVFSRLFKGAWVVVQIAPLATLFAFLAGVTLGLPAGY